MTRTIVTWRVRSDALVGTCHVPTPGRAFGLSGSSSIGVLLLNSGAAMRSGNSDLSVHIGDRLALRGFPVFRFDFPGLGDSSGAAPVDLDAYWREVVNGRNDGTTVALIERIRLEFGVARVVVGGLCASALPSVRAFAGSNDNPVGLILLEPEFQLVADDAAEDPNVAFGWFGERSIALRRVASNFGANGGGRFARAIGAAREFLRTTSSRWTPPALPADANVKLIALWRESFEAGIPSLVVVAAGQRTDRYVTRIIATLPPRTSGLLACVRVPATNHLFTGGDGRDAVVLALEDWMVVRFGGGVAPLITRGLGADHGGA